MSKVKWFGITKEELFPHTQKPVEKPAPKPAEETNVITAPRALFNGCKCHNCDGVGKIKGVTCSTCLGLGTIKRPDSATMMRLVNNHLLFEGYKYGGQWKRKIDDHDPRYGHEYHIHRGSQLEVVFVNEETINALYDKIFQD